MGAINTPGVPNSSGIRPLTAGGGSLNVQSEAFTRPTSNPAIVPQMIGQEPKRINIGAKEFTPSMPSRNSQPEQSPSLQPARQVPQRQYQQLLDFHKVISDKLSKAIEAGAKVRLEELVEDASVQV